MEKLRVAVIGCGDFAAIWSEEQYQINLDEEDVEALVSSLEECGL